MNKETVDLINKSKIVIDKLIESDYDIEETIDKKLDVFFAVLMSNFPQTSSNLFPTVRMLLNSENEKNPNFYTEEREIIIKKITDHISQGRTYEECIAGSFKGQQEIYKNSGISGKLILLGLIKLDAIIAVFKK